MSVPAAICLMLTTGPCSRHELPLLLRAPGWLIERETSRLLQAGVLVELLQGQQCLLALRRRR